MRNLKPTRNPVYIIPEGGEFQGPPQLCACGQQASGVWPVCTTCWLQSYGFAKHVLEWHTLPIEARWSRRWHSAFSVSVRPYYRFFLSSKYSIIRDVNNWQLWAKGVQAQCFKPANNCVNRLEHQSETESTSPRWKAVHDLLTGKECSYCQDIEHTQGIDLPLPIHVSHCLKGPVAHYFYEEALNCGLAVPTCLLCNVTKGAAEVTGLHRLRALGRFWEYPGLGIDAQPLLDFTLKCDQTNDDQGDLPIHALTILGLRVAAFCDHETRWLVCFTNPERKLFGMCCDECWMLLEKYPGHLPFARLSRPRKCANAVKAQRERSEKSYAKKKAEAEAAAGQSSSPNAELSRADTRRFLPATPKTQETQVA